MNVVHLIGMQCFNISNVYLFDSPHDNLVTSWGTAGTRSNLNHCTPNCFRATTANPKIEYRAMKDIMLYKLHLNETSHVRVDKNRNDVQDELASRRQVTCSRPGHTFRLYKIRYSGAYIASREDTLSRCHAQEVHMKQQKSTSIEGFSPRGLPRAGLGNCVG